MCLLATSSLEKKSEAQGECCMCSSVSGSYGAQSLVLPAPAWSVNSGRNMRGKGGFHWVHCITCPPQSSPLVKKVFSGRLNSGERFALPPSHALTLSAEWFKCIYKAAGWGLQGQVRGMDQSKVKWPGQGTNYDLGLLSPISLQTQLTEPLESLLFYSGPYATLKHSKVAWLQREEGHSDQARFPGIMLFFSYLEDTFGDP